MRKEKRKKVINYAVIGLGHIAQVAVLPAFAHAGKNSRLSAMVSGDPLKEKKLGSSYKVPIYHYDEFPGCLSKHEVDAVYIALPNHMHCEYTVRAAEAGFHVLCEKPMAVTEEECRRMITATDKARVNLMIAYRLHFEESNMITVQMIEKGRIGVPRIFNAVFTMQVRPDNIRLDRDKGGGTLYDIGIYCINAARYLFHCEPLEVFAQSFSGSDSRFDEVDEMTSAILRFPEGRTAIFTVSFGAAPVSNYRIVGTRGDIEIVNAFEYVGSRRRRVTINEVTKEEEYKAADQFASELLYFSDCILKKTKPEPGGLEGMSDVKIIEALYRSALSRKPVQLNLERKRKRPGPKQILYFPPVSKPDLVHAESASS